MSPDQVAQYGIPGLFALVLIAVGRAADRLLARHLATLDRIVERLDQHGEALARIEEAVRRDGP
jgi:hypothetical protein